MCEGTKREPLKPVEPRGSLTLDQLKTCDEQALYYGIGQQPDYAAAFECGWYQRAHPQHTDANMFYGPGVLAMLYANGKGVERNYDLAVRFACENEWAAEAEMEGRIQHLEHLRGSGPSSRDFDLCDDVTSGLSDGVCTGIQTRKADAARQMKIKEQISRLTPSAQAGFSSLDAAEREFEKARIENEVDLSGTSRAAFQLAEEARLRDQFLINLECFARGDIPDSSAAEFSALDQKLNETYQRIGRTPQTKWDGTVTPEGIRQTERKWIALVEAWITFARTAYPNVSATRLRAQLTRLRLHQLRSLASISE